MDRQVDVALKRLRGDTGRRKEIFKYCELFFFLLNFSPSFSRLKQGRRSSADRRIDVALKRLKGGRRDFKYYELFFFFLIFSSFFFQTGKKG